MELRGRAWKYGDDIDTDVIIPARYLNTSEPEELAKYCLKDLDEDFVNKMNEGDMIVAAKNFGCGSSREHAPLAIKAAGVSCVIAKSFARIFYRNAINIGLPILESIEAVDGIDTEDEVEVDVESGEIRNLTKGEVYQAEPFPEFMQDIIQVGGLINYVAGKVDK
ncbi:3-isopropylmalate dehydratase small subunit [Sporohalobacter salinus]|uniref:3-isopropylmalate dehydratase small subunit n=1 Tax=Sporohalobacter salinus TaxID=1494606 RepID=UPI00195FDC2E|nr:3-isopropylmalate dehydratase small subunit [Sporohalobacter salinus]MBM7624029.1 3-isopropylmalate/(R)-2-methylmalate dehydratase small subunit [Sporohalobacter salinus]